MPNYPNSEAHTKQVAHVTDDSWRPGDHPFPEDIVSSRHVGAQLLGVARSSLAEDIQRLPVDQREAEHQLFVSNTTVAKEGRDHRYMNSKNSLHLLVQEVHEMSQHVKKLRAVRTDRRCNGTVFVMIERILRFSVILFGSRPTQSTKANLKY